MSKKPNAEAFLAALQGPSEPEEAARPALPPQAVVHELPRPAAEPVAAKAPVMKPAASRGRGKAKPPRSELKHFGGYVDDDTLEKIALLRVRLKKDNSELIVLAMDELHRKHNAKRAFGDA